MKIKRYIPLAIGVVLGVVAFVIEMSMNAKINSLTHENVAKSFSNDKNYEQITIFISPSADFTKEKARYLKYKIEKALVDSSLSSENGERLYIDGYSAVRNQYLQTEAGKSITAKATVIGGDYSLFHNELASLPDITNDVNHDRILLSSNGAWQLFGGYDLYDFKLTDGGDASFYISGVYDENDTEAHRKFYGNYSSCVMDMTNYPQTPITCYELIMVSPLKDFAVKTVTDALELDKSQYILVENSKRFSLPRLFEGLTGLLKADEVMPDGVVLSPEEINARNAEKSLSLSLAFLMLFSAYPVIYIIILLVKALIFVKKLLDRYIFNPIRDKLSYS